MKEDSIFREIYGEYDFIDKKLLTDEEGVDIIVPIFNTNDLFGANLHSWYREIPINRLIVGNAGSTDNSKEILKNFPRVEIIDQSDRHSLGFCIAELISLVETEWFVYLHSDVYLPENWFSHMKKYQNKYDWYECDSKNLILIEYHEKILKNVKRAYSGSQMGRKDAFKKILPSIDDDYLYRNEDMVFQDLIQRNGYKYGRVFDTFHYHQIMNKKGEREPKFKNIMIQRKKDLEWEKMVNDMQARGIIKYCKPKDYLIRSVNISLYNLYQQNKFNIDEFKIWVKENNEIWLKFINFKKLEGKKTVFQKVFYTVKKTFYPIIKKLVK